MTDPLAPYLRPGFPKFSQTDTTQSYTFEYVGPDAALTVPAQNVAWGDYPGSVASATKEPVQSSGYSILTVVVSTNTGDGTIIGTVSEVAFELEWVAISRPLLEHPAFQSGGGALTQTDQVEIEWWREYKNKDYKFYARKLDGNLDTTSEETLSANAQKYAAYILIGVETFTDFAPVARRNSTYVGGPPNAAGGGAKESLPGDFPNKPSGSWEWVKSADRSNRAAGQRKWQRTEEWTGAFKVLLDNRSLYYP